MHNLKLPYDDPHYENTFQQSNFVSDKFTTDKINLIYEGIDISY